jgi:hypothetical protein
VRIGGGSNIKATRPTGEIALTRKGAGGNSFQTFFRPPAPRAASLLCRLRRRRWRFARSFGLLRLLRSLRKKRRTTKRQTTRQTTEQQKDDHTNE